MMENKDVRINVSALNENQTYRQNHNNERYQNANNNEFAETFYLEGAADDSDDCDDNQVNSSLTKHNKAFD